MSGITAANQGPIPILQISKIKKQEEEAWISGEELCTDGSSDEDENYSEAYTRLKPRQILLKFKLPKQPSPLARAKFPNHIKQTQSQTNKLADNDKNAEKPCSLANVTDQGGMSGNQSDCNMCNIPVESTFLDLLLNDNQLHEALQARCSQSCHELHDDLERIQWRPKRGSIKIPLICDD